MRKSVYFGDQKLHKLDSGYCNTQSMASVNRDEGDTQTLGHGSSRILNSRVLAAKIIIHIFLMIIFPLDFVNS
jgi:hypothetical protein